MANQPADDDERRRRQLDAGRELLRHPDAASSTPSLALSHVRLADVAERQRVRKTALYYYWSSHEEFWGDVLATLETEGHLVEGIRAATSRCGSIGPHPTPGDIWTLGDTMYDTLNQDQVLPVAMATLAFEADEVSRPALQDAAEQSVARIEAFLRRSLPNVGLSIKPSRDLHRLATALLGLLVGLSVQQRVAQRDTDAVALHPAREVSLFAAAASALILESCDVVADPDELLEELRAMHEAL